MPFPMPFRASIIIGLLLFVLHLSAYAASPIGKISTIKPRKGYEITLTRAGKKLPAVKRDTDVWVGDIIETGSVTQVIVRFDDGNTLLIRSASKITIEEYEKGQKGSIKTEGIIHGLIDNAYEGSADSHFEFTSSSAIAGVRGSIIGVFVSPQSGQIMAFLQEGAKPAYIRPPESRAFTDFNPNTVASSSRDAGFQVVNFNPSVHSALRLPDTALDAIRTDNIQMFEQMSELDTMDTSTLEEAMPPPAEPAAGPPPAGETPLADEGTADTQTSFDPAPPQETLPAKKSADQSPMPTLSAEDKSGASLFPTITFGSKGKDGRSGMVGMFMDMRSKAQGGVVATMTGTGTSLGGLFSRLDPTRDLQQQLDTFIQQVDELRRTTEEQQRQIQSSRVRVNINF